MRVHIDIQREKVYVWEDEKGLIEFPFALMEHMNAGSLLDIKEIEKHELKMYAAKKAYNKWKSRPNTTLLKQVNGIWYPEQDTFFQDGIPFRGFQKAMEHTKQRRLMADIGAHCGFSTRYFAPHFCKVVAFEPNHQSFQCLVRNQPNMTNIVAYKTALGDKQQEVQMEYDVTRYGNTGCYMVSGSGDKIQMTTLDTYELTNVDLIKIDVEGYELEVLQGGQNTIKKNKPVVVMEVKEGLSERHGIHYLQAPNYLISMDYKQVDEEKRDKIFVPC